MKFSAPAIIAALAAATAPSSCVDGYNLSLFSRPMFVTRSPGMLSPFSSLLQEQQDLMNQVFEQSSPRYYDLVESKDKFELSIDVPGMSIDDIDVSLNEDENVLTIVGQRETKNGNSRSMNKFAQSFSLDAATKVSELSAALENGVLTVTAPKEDLSMLEDDSSHIRKIPILSSSMATTTTNADNKDDKEVASSATMAASLSDGKENVKEEVFPKNVKADEVAAKNNVIEKEKQAAN